MESQGAAHSPEKQKTHIQTRAETSRSLEDAEKYKALDTLAELGLLIPLRDLEIFHGRVGKAGEQWQVNPQLSNARNDTGNNNVNRRSSLYAGEKQTADDFSIAREDQLVREKYEEFFKDKIKNYTPQERKEWLKRLGERAKKLPYPTRKFKETDLDTFLEIRKEIKRLENNLSEEERQLLRDQAQKALHAEVHQIVSDNPDASVIDLSFNPKKLTDEDQQRYYEALDSLVLPLTEGAPVDFDAKTHARPIWEELKLRGKDLIPSSEVNEIAQKTGTDAKVVLHCVSAYNSIHFAFVMPSYLVDKFLRHSSDIIADTFDLEGSKQEVPINLEYAQRYLRSAHIVAAKDMIDSATLERDNVPTFSFFDLEKIGTRDQLKAEKRTMQEKMGGLIPHLPELLQIETTEQARELLLVLDDAYARPEKIMEAAGKIDQYQALFDSGTGVKEGFTLGEHTETVLRNFDENFSDVIPVEYIAPLRLAVLIHDLGKPLAVAQGEKPKQKEYNRVVAKDFLEKIGIDPVTQELFVTLITDGSELAFALQKGSGEQPLEAMHSFAQKTLQRYLGTAEVNEAQIRAFIGMCKIVQLCDGGAYTSMAITRRPGMGRFRNPPSFNESFAQPTGPGKRDIKYA